MPAEVTSSRPGHPFRPAVSAPLSPWRLLVGRRPGNAIVPRPRLCRARVKAKQRAARTERHFATFPHEHRRLRPTGLGWSSVTASDLDPVVDSSLPWTGQRSHQTPPSETPASKPCQVQISCWFPETDRRRRPSLPMSQMTSWVSMFLKVSSRALWLLRMSITPATCPSAFMT